jgi:hypothetical protein
MSLKRITRLAASAGVTLGLAFGGVALSAPADAATGSTSADLTYACTSPLGAFDVPATITIDNLPDTLTGLIPAGTPIIGTLDFSQANGLAGLLSTLGVTVQDLLGSTPLNPVGVQVNNLLTTVAGQVATFQGTLTSSFPSTSDLPLPIPAGLDFSLLQPLLGPLGVNCALKPGGTIVVRNSNGTTSNVGIPKMGAKIKAKAVKRTIHHGQKGVVKVTVKTTNGAKGVGSLVTKVKGQKAKTITLKNGKVKLSVKKLKMGLNKIKLKYLGNGYTNPAKKTVKIKVVR